MCWFALLQWQRQSKERYFSTRINKQSFIRRLFSLSRMLRLQAPRVHWNRMDCFLVWKYVTKRNKDSMQYLTRHGDIVTPETAPCRVWYVTYVTPRCSGNPHKKRSCCYAGRHFRRRFTSDIREKYRKHAFRVLLVFKHMRLTITTIGYTWQRELQMTFRGAGYSCGARGYSKVRAISSALCGASPTARRFTAGSRQTSWLTCNYRKSVASKRRTTIFFRLSWKCRKFLRPLPHYHRKQGPRSSNSNVDHNAFPYTSTVSDQSRETAHTFSCPRLCGLSCRKVLACCEKNICS